MYRDYAFLRQVDYTEQLVSHLLSLSTVDLAAFSANYIPATITYKVSIHTNKSALPLWLP